jgi:hypothetical protein
MFATGSTAVTCLVRNEESGRMLYTANAGALMRSHPSSSGFIHQRCAFFATDAVPGDARAVLGRASGAIRLSYDHKGALSVAIFSPDAR